MMDLTQLHVTGALGALGGIVEMEAYDKIKISGSNLSQKKNISNHIQDGGLRRGLMTYGWLYQIIQAAMGIISS